VNNKRHLFPLAALLFMIGVAGLSRFGTHVRTVDAVGLSGSGFTLGIGFSFLVFAAARRVRA
jgi:hypothetical protein